MIDQKVLLFICFFIIVTPAVDITDEYGLSNELHCWLLPKKSKVRIILYLLFISQYKAFNQLFLINTSVLKWVYHAGCKAFKRRPVYSVIVRNFSFI